MAVLKATEYVAAAAACYYPTKLTGSGFTLLKDTSGHAVTTTDTSGCIAAALVDTSGHIVIGYQGTTSAAQRSVDYAVGSGTNPATLTAFKEAVAFALRVETVAKQEGYSTSQISVTGHSLGGIEAEYVAMRTGLGGASFGATGLGTYHSDGHSHGFVNYVDYGDEVGNVGSDTALVTTGPAKAGLQYHYGTVQYLGHSADRATLRTTFALQHSAAPLTSAQKAQLAAGLVTVNADHLIGHYVRDVTALPKAVSLCFLRGTIIATPCGGRAVETLRPGDLVSVIEAGSDVARPLVWVGGRSMDAASWDHRDEAYPVRIRADAFAAGQPCRDLLVTPEHCILTQAGLVPARMLVNGASIVIDRTMPCYDFFHVELASHGILLAEALPCESYLDTGNRDLIDAQAEAFAVRAMPAMAAPLAVAPEQVQPVWQALAARAGTLGFTPAALGAITDQPDLRLLLASGTELTACWHDDVRHMFHIPRGERPIRLLSRAARASDVVGPFIDDRRLLGVAVDRLVLWTGLEDRIVPAVALALPGWHALEDDRRWTNGSAALDLPPAQDETFLDIHLAGTLPYRMAA